MNLDGHCNKPDRDVPKLKCGYPLPCPWHVADAVIEIDHQVATVTIVSPKGARAAGRLREIAKALTTTRPTKRRRNPK